MTDKLELHIIEIPKAIKQIQNEPQNRIAQWMLFLSNPNDEEVTKITEENKAIGQAMGKLKELSADEELRRVAELRQKAILDEKAIKRCAEEIGREEGIKEGIKEEKINMTKKLLSEKMDFSFIAKVTGLPITEIEKIASLLSKS